MRFPDHPEGVSVEWDANLAGSRREFWEHIEIEIGSSTQLRNAPGQPPWASITLSISFIRRIVSERATTIFW